MRSTHRALGIAAVLSLAALAACGGDDSGTSATEAPVTTAAPATTAAGDTATTAPGASTTEAVATTAPAEEAPEGEIDVWMGDPIGATQQPIVQALAAGFESQYPDSKINLRFLGSDAHQTYLTSIAGGTVPCVALIGNTWTPEFAGLDALEPNPQTPEEMAGTYVQGMIDSTILDGVSYAVPYDIGVRSLIYRKDLFDAAGIAAPTTWDEVLAAAQQVQAANAGVYGFGIVGGNQWYYLPMVWNWGGSIATEAGGKYTADINSPEAVAAFDFYAKLLTEYKLAPEGAVTWGGGDAAKAIALGQVAMMVGGSWDLKTILAQNPDMATKIATVPMPSGPGGNSDTFAGGSNLAIFKDCKNKDLANFFVDYMMQTAQLTPVVTGIGLMPATLDALAVERESGAFSQPLFQAFATQVDHTQSIPQVPTWGKVEGTGAIVNAMQSVLNGSSSAQDALDRLNGEIDEAIG